MAVAFFVENAVRSAETNSYSSAKTSPQHLEESYFIVFLTYLDATHIYK